MPYHIVRNKSKTKPFTVVLLADNGEVISSHQLATKQAAFKNIKSQIKQLLGCDYVQDDTVEKPSMRLYGYDRQKVGVVVGALATPSAKYIPGKNPKRKKKSKTSNQ